MYERTSHEQDTQLKGNGTQGQSGLNHLLGVVAVCLALLALFTVVAAVMVVACRSTSPPSAKAKQTKAKQKEAKKKSVVRHAQKRGQFQAKACASTRRVMG